MRFLRATFGLFFAVSLVATACSSASDAQDDEDALVMGLASSDGTALSQFRDLESVPSLDPTQGSWVAYTMGAPDQPASTMAFGFHTQSPVFVLVDVAADAVTVIGDAADQQAALSTLKDDLAAYLETADKPSADGVSIQTKSEVAKRLFTAAGKTLTAARRTKFVETIRLYTSTGFIAFNKFLREGYLPADWTKTTAKREVATLTQALRAIPPTTGTVYRYGQTGVVNASLNKKRLQSLLSSLKPGGTFSDPAFLSATTASDALEMFHYTTVEYRMASKTGANISALSVHPNEREILFAPATKFHIDSVQGVFVKTPKSAEFGFPGAETWAAFVAAAKKVFPGVTDEMVKQKFANQEIPRIVVQLTEI